MRWLLLLAAVSGCGDPPPKAVAPPVTEVAPSAEGEAQRVAPTEAVEEPPTAEPEPAEPAEPSASSGVAFNDEVKALYRVAACGGDAAPPSGTAKAVDKHCHKLDKIIARYRKKWLDRAMPYLAGLPREKDLPDVAVYPFGGGDLLSALATFPNAREITTISLEAAGDVRAVNAVSKRKLSKELGLMRKKISRLVGSAYSTTKSLQATSHSRLPGPLVFALVAMSVHEFEPTELRYFDLNDDGSIHYLEQGDIDTRSAEFKAYSDAAYKKHRSRKNHLQVWKAQAAIFENVEVRFHKRGSDEQRIFRHIVANLDDEHLSADSRVLRHLEAKGKVVAMTKAASYLLWYDSFSMIRGYLIDHIEWMVSDHTGIPPEHAQKAGFEQLPFGRYKGAYFHRNHSPRRIRKQIEKLWAASSQKKIPFRFGYPDSEGNGHLMVTRRKRQ